MWQFLAVEAVDASFQRVIDVLKSVGGQMLITVDHGNIERRVDKETGQPRTINPVPLAYIGGDKPLVAGGSLPGLASTVPAMLGVPQLLEMTDRSLIKFV